MNGFILFGAVLGMVSGIAISKQLPKSTKVCGIIWFVSVLCFIDNVGPSEAMVFILASVVGAAIVIASVEYFYRGPQRTYKVGSDVR